MAIVVGIDEAGLGPVLGPLVVGSVAFETADGRSGESLWRALSPAVCRQPSDGAWRTAPVVVADSKRLYHGLRGAEDLRHLERGVLAFLAVAGVRPRDLGAALAALAPGATAACGSVPWYADLSTPLPFACEPADVEAAAARLERRMAAAGVRLAAVRAEVVLEAEVNRLIGEAGNKAEAAFAVVSRHLCAARALATARPLVVHCDRQGGRFYYLGGLGRAFPGCFTWALHEDDRTSLYRIDDGGRTVDVDFSVECESRRLEVALASMVAKYLRELLMERLNAFFAARLPGLAPTAGYRPDGWRFLREVAPALSLLSLEESALRRLR